MVKRAAFSLVLMATVAGVVVPQSLADFESLSALQRSTLWIPGAAQIYLGQPEGYVYAGIGVPALAAGAALSTVYLTSAKTDRDQWKFESGLLSSEIGASFESYSLWAYLRDFEDADGASGPRIGRESYLELLGAPYDPRYLFDYRALPVVGLELASFLIPDTVAAMGGYFEHRSASFAGVEMPASAALASEIGFALTVNLFVAVTEETLFRGIALEKLGPLWTSLLFGAVHASNILFDRSIDAASILQVVLQTGFATIAGYYLAVVTQESGYDLRPAIAYHYWHNVVAMITQFLYDNGRPSSSTAASGGSAGIALRVDPLGPAIVMSVPLW